ncbi:PREDICTED: geranylgeranyl transferase type-2 subunit alpha isoform X2 [Drosophila arizonae]|uniref:Geranylgeranyl transferase type-2 subunit alpha n=1 Tax=Drosophila arizonae TaxID=7263 RepID=A0ABM1NN63_DROAR|nr:PREDICTED: geranylgeranyl transferase type-2 subunit alpha isoform X2 [Drosophila arizonae]
MHGRVKVRTTEEERERKKKEQVLKMRAYRAAMTRIQKKRSLGELDDEMLGLTVQILLRNPDITTLWNIRRECVLRKTAELQKAMEEDEARSKQEVGKEDESNKPKVVKEDESDTPKVKKEDESDKPKVGEQADGDKKAAEQKADDTKEILAQQLQSIYKTELDLTEQCLMVNPKSYNGWHHRCWTLEQNPQADWQRELQLCNKYLKYDERNFHTWDYRRYVSDKASVPAEQELDFCTEKIKVNFSNYSSWHHRSLLLPKLYPNEQQDRPMSEHKLKEELEMVLTAAFTDPNDSSAWFYQRWLLGNGAHSEQTATVAAFRCWPHKAQLSLKKSHPELAQLTVQLISGQQTLQLQPWTAVNSEKNQWQCEQAIAIDPSQDYFLDVAGQRMQLAVQPSDQSLYYFVPPHATSSCSKELLTELQTQLQSCLDLLEYEPDSKWTLLTSALLMRAIDVSSYHEQSLTHLAKLEQVDALRQGYYKDLSARWTMEMALAKWPTSSSYPQLFELPTKMPRMPYAQYLIVADKISS